MFHFILKARYSIFLVALLAAEMLPAAEPLPGTQPLTLEGDLAALMVTGIDRYLDRDADQTLANRPKFWRRDFTSREAYAASIQTNRTRLEEILGIRDQREGKAFEQFGTIDSKSGAVQRDPGQVARNNLYQIHSVRWRVFRQVHGEGLLLRPIRPASTAVIALPDCDQTPEQLAGLTPGIPAPMQFARKFAEAGATVLIPYLIDRSDTHSGLPGVRKIRHSQREVLWRAAYQMGRTIAGYEIQKALAAVDILQGEGLRVGIAGYGEGGMIAFYAAAVDPRIETAGVSGYFQSREKLWLEPIYRNVWGLLEQFGEAEIASLIAPRALIIEAGKYPETEYPAPGQPHDGAAPGKLIRPNISDVKAEFERAKTLTASLGTEAALIEAAAEEFGSTAFCSAIFQKFNLVPSETKASDFERLSSPPDQAARSLRQYSEILEDTQWLMRESEFTRAKFWSKADKSSREKFVETSKWYRSYFWDEIVSRLPEPALPPNPRSRQIYETDKIRGYEVVLDVYPDVFAYGILTLPKNLGAGERRPVVVCQHGLEGRPADVADPKVDHYAYHTYACRLAERGFVTFSPQNPYIGRNVFRQVLRKAQPLKKTLFGFITRQHQVITDWLAAQSFTDPERIAFYGLSYGGKTAMRIPALLDRYCLSICSADYNEWIWKNVTSRHNYSYLYTGEYDMPEFNLGNTYNYAEMSWLILPRPFMVERGHDDGVAPDEWVAYEYAKTRRHYVKMGLADKTEIEFFNGPHTINGKNTFDFLHKHLQFPPR